MKFIKVRDVKSPERGTYKSAGIDFFVPNDFGPAKVFPGNDLLIPSGIKAQVPENCMLMAADKSGVVTSKGAALRAGITPKPTAFESTVITGAKIIDEDYQGEIHIHIINVGLEAIVIQPGMKVAQFIVVPVVYEDLEELSSEKELFAEKTERGSVGFGSTDLK